MAEQSMIWEFEVRPWHSIWELDLNDASSNRIEDARDASVMLAMMLMVEALA